MNLYNNKYRISTARHKDWNYANEGAYFITICTKDRINYFGNINEGKMLLNEMGRIANNNWLAIPEHFNHVRLGAHIIMPNHVHGILIIEKGNTCEELIANKSSLDIKTLQCNVSTDNEDKIVFMSSISPKKGSIPTIIRSYKSACTKTIRSIGGFEWQARYHDHIIRDANSFDKIEQYIINNPLTWQDDVHFMQ